MEVPESVSAFVRLAKDYCLWAEATPINRDMEGSRAIDFLSALYSAALRLPDVETSDVADASRVSNEEWEKVYRRFGTLPVNYYSEIFNPLTVPPEEPVVGDAADDLADIYRDLRDGLALYSESSWQAAVCSWVEDFRIHWGRHALSALSALHYDVYHAP